MGSTIPAISRLDYHVRMIANPGRIHSLPSVLASQIAAGEIIERPASIVKELVENSLDAGASRMQIDIEAAGSRLIRIRDDGAGIHPDDLSLAVAPHSTSKIHRVEDLAAITSLGFRGEALASIAAVARLRICSGQPSRTAYAIEAEPGGPVASPVPASHPAGTTIEVRDLFFSMPARRKFLRTEQTEFLHILELVKSLSLSRSGLGIQLTHNGRTVFSVSAASGMTDRIRQVFGSSFPDAACLVDEADGALRLQGVAGQAQSARSQADRQYVFLNGRLIRDRRLSHALRTAYQDALPAGRYAPFLLYLEMDPHDYDINVHPTKHEVRFRAGRDIHDFVFSALQRSLEADRPLATWQAEAASTPPATAQRDMAIAEPRRGSYQTEQGADPGTGRAAVSEQPAPFGKWLDCVLDRYLLMAAAEAITVIDSRGAVERLARIDLEQPLTARPLLLPETATVDARQAAAVERWQPVLAELAIEIELSSPTQVMLRSLPSVLPAVEAQSLLPALLDRITEATSDATDLCARVRLLLARHAGDVFSPAADETFCRQLPRRLWTAMSEQQLQPPWPWQTLDAAGLAAWFDSDD